MRLRYLIIPAVVILLLSGCGTKKHLNRDRGLFEPRPTVTEAGLRAYEASSDTYDGKLNILYEKKIKGSGDSPILIGNGVLAFKSTRHRFIGFDQLSGDMVIQVKKRRGFVLDPVIVDSQLVLIQRSKYGKIKVRNLFTGKVMEERVINEIRSGPIIVMNKLIFGTTGGLLSLTLPGLETDWLSESEQSVDIPAVSDSKAVYFVSSEGILSAVDIADGGELWTLDCGSAVVSDLSLGRNLYFGLADGRIMAVDNDSGEIIWAHPFEYQFHGGMAEFDGRLFAGCTDGMVYCLSSSSGEKIWQYETEGIVTASPVIYGPAVLIGSHDRHFYSLDRLTGELIDRRRLEGPVVYAAAVDNDRVFVTCRRNRLYCFEGNR